jgi:hypothetical protein
MKLTAVTRHGGLTCGTRKRNICVIYWNERSRVDALGAKLKASVAQRSPDVGTPN